MLLEEIQNKISKQKLDAIIITRNNQFLEEDIREEENLLQQISNFSGSAGRLLIYSQGNAILFVDGRYELQAEQEVRSKIIVHCTANKLSFSDWLKYKLKSYPCKIGYNPWCLSIKEVETLQKELPQIKLIACEEEPQLSPQTFKVFEHNIEYAGISSEEKLSQVINALPDKKLDGILITAPDSVSWLLNLRANCLNNTPVMRAYALIDKDGHISIFADNLDFSEIEQPNFQRYRFNELPNILKKYKKKTLGISRETTPYQIKRISENYKIELINIPEICQELKSQKNEVELSGIRKCHIRDGVALTKFLYWLDQQDITTLNEKRIINKLHDFRAEQDLYYSESFDTIAAYKEHGAIVHYHAKEEAEKNFTPNSVLLLDSGAQYYDGTTDVTRTIMLGKENQELIDAYTYVLKAHIKLSSAIFPTGTSGIKLDILSREELWKHGMDYNHGTGHGVGCFLNVHEGPIGISPNYSQTGLNKGMILSIEPGYYLANRYGIRIENLVEVTTSTIKGMLCFSALTLVPYEQKLINIKLLDTQEIEWINNYHQRVYNTLKNKLSKEEKTWLKHACRKIGE